MTTDKKTDETKAAIETPVKVDDKPKVVAIKDSKPKIVPGTVVFVVAGVRDCIPNDDGTIPPDDGMKFISYNRINTSGVNKEAVQAQLDAMATKWNKRQPPKSLKRAMVILGYHEGSKNHVWRHSAAGKVSCQHCGMEGKIVKYGKVKAFVPVEITPCKK